MSSLVSQGLAIIYMVLLGPFGWTFKYVRGLFASLLTNKKQQSTLYSSNNVRFDENIVELRFLVKHTQLVLASFKSIFKISLGFVVLPGSRFSFLSLSFSFFCLFFHSRLFSFPIPPLVQWTWFLFFFFLLSSIWPILSFWWLNTAIYR